MHLSAASFNWKHLQNRFTLQELQVLLDSFEVKSWLSLSFASVLHYRKASSRAGQSQTGHRDRSSGVLWGGAPAETLSSAIAMQPIMEQNLCSVGFISFHRPIIGSFVITEPGHQCQQCGTSSHHWHVILSLATSCSTRSSAPAA